MLPDHVVITSWSLITWLLTQAIVKNQISIFARIVFLRVWKVTNAQPTHCLTYSTRGIWSTKHCRQNYNNKLQNLRLFWQTCVMWPSAVANRLRHFSHFISVTSPLLCSMAWRFRASHRLKSSEHFSQRYLVVPVCRFSCFRWSLDCLKAFGQNEHLKGRSPKHNKTLNCELRARKRSRFMRWISICDW